MKGKNQILVRIENNWDFNYSDGDCTWCICAVI